VVDLGEELLEVLGVGIPVRTIASVSGSSSARTATASSSTSSTASRTPFAARSREIAPPRPPAPPVTTATVPASPPRASNHVLMGRSYHGRRRRAGSPQPVGAQAGGTVRARLSSGCTSMQPIAISAGAEISDVVKRSEMGQARNATRAEWPPSVT
jgi:hypothetical protein